MQSKTFSKLSTWAFILASLIAVIWAASKAASTTPLPVDLVPVATNTPTPVAPLQNLSMTIIKTPSGMIKAFIASTSIERETGLSGQTSLPKDSGLLFVFPNAGAYGFWMKDMNFPIDIVWMSADKRVSGIVPAAATSSYPEIFYPSAPAMYVLELNAGAASDHRIATGTKLVF